MAQNERGQSIFMPFGEQQVLYRSDTHAPLSVVSHSGNISANKHFNYQGSIKVYDEFNFLVQARSLIVFQSVGLMSL
jgi:hypothetical protein